jgi:hypothetical protein
MDLPGEDETVTQLQVRYPGLDSLQWQPRS